MIQFRTSEGPKTYMLRGILSRRGKRAVQRASVRTPNGDRTFWQVGAEGGNDFTIVMSPSKVSGAASYDADSAIRTATVTAEVTGAVGDVAHQWEKIEGSSWTIERKSGGLAAFVANSVAPNSTESAVFRCTATDAAGRSASADVVASARNYGGSSQ